MSLGGPIARWTGAAVAAGAAVLVAASAWGWAHARPPEPVAATRPASHTTRAAVAADPSADAAGADFAATLAWPPRWGFEDKPIPGIVRLAAEPLGAWRPVRVAGVGGEMTPDEADLADAAALLRAIGAPEGLQAAFELGGSFIFRTRRLPAEDAGPEVLKFITATAQPADGDAPERLALQRTWFALYENGPGVDHRGLALVVPGMFGTPEPMVESLVGALRARGWAVLRMLSHPSRFTQRATLKVKPDRIEEAAAAAADLFGNRVAECAYAVQAATAWVARERPALAAGPRVAVGLSGGAMVLPTVVAREPDAYDAAVLIAGGANFLSIIAASNYTDMIDAVRPEWTSPPTEAQRRALEEAYQRLATLDAYHTAAALRGKPVLMLHATHDLAVPARNGHLLWERLGRPERWTYPVGHELLFMMLPAQQGRIAAWLEAHLPPPGAGGRAR